MLILYANQLRPRSEGSPFLMPTRPFGSHVDIGFTNDSMRPLIWRVLRRGHRKVLLHKVNQEPQPVSVYDISGQ